jgi:hypothetical protein
MSCAGPPLPIGTPALATSFGSIGTLRPPDPDSFVQIGVSMTLEPETFGEPITRRRDRHRPGIGNEMLELAGKAGVHHVFRSAVRRGRGVRHALI